MIDLIYKVFCYWRNHGTRALRHLIVRKLVSRIQKQEIREQVRYLEKPGMGALTDLLNTRFESLTPLRTYHLPSAKTPRVNLITDSIGSGSLFGGVGTALIFAALLANRLGAPLRIVTRTKRAQPSNLDHVLSLYGIQLAHEVQFKFAAFYDRKYELDMIEGDVFITTSWWTTAATLPSVPHRAIIYLLQEDERMFYPFSDDRMKCEAILRNRHIRYLVNTRLMFDHLVQDGLDNMVARGRWFEPAFPSQVFYPRARAAGGKRRFFFYARPNNLRNLFYLGIEVIEQAILQQVLDLQHWDIILVGKDIPAVTLGNGYTPTKCENLSWSDYAELIGTVDLGLSLMYTPHPSYPPLDLAASGAVVVTNQFANKQVLTGYSKNIICAALERDALVEGLRQGVALALNTPLREQHYRDNGIIQDWQQAFSGIIEQLAGEA